MSRSCHSPRAPRKTPALTHTPTASFCLHTLGTTPCSGSALSLPDWGAQRPNKTHTAPGGGGMPVQLCHLLRGPSGAWWDSWGLGWGSKGRGYYWLGQGLFLEFSQGFENNSKKHLLGPVLSFVQPSSIKSGGYREQWRDGQEGSLNLHHGIQPRPLAREGLCWAPTHPSNSQ